MPPVGAHDTHLGTCCATCGQPLGYRTTDKLTGLLDRWAWDKAATEILDQVGDQPAVLLMLDLDRFKEINDTHGHLAGDAVLRAIASIVRGAVRQTDIVGRYGGHGGDEFLVLLPATDLDLGEKVAARILTRIRTAAVAAPSACEGRLTITGVTASAGLAAWDHYRDKGLMALFEGADAALLRAKQDGRDRITTDSQPADIRPAAAPPIREQLRALLRVLPGEHELDVLAALSRGPLPYQVLTECAPECTLERLAHNGLVACDREGDEIVSCALTPGARELFDKLLPALDWVGKIGAPGLPGAVAGAGA